jgi:hypothetical protein
MELNLKKKNSADSNIQELECVCVLILLFLNRYVDFFTIPSHNLTDYSENGVTYHPSRLMGLADILNTVNECYKCHSI